MKARGLYAVGCSVLLSGSVFVLIPGCNGDMDDVDTLDRDDEAVEPYIAPQAPVDTTPMPDQGMQPATPQDLPEPTPAPQSEPLPPTESEQTPTPAP